MVNNRELNKWQRVLAFIVAVILTMIIIGLFSCTKPEYCHECHKKDGGTVIYCGYTDDEFRYVYDWNCEYLRDTMDCKLIER